MYEMQADIKELKKELVNMKKTDEEVKDIVMRTAEDTKFSQVAAPSQDVMNLP